MSITTGFGRTRRRKRKWPLQGMGVSAAEQADAWAYDQRAVKRNEVKRQVGVMLLLIAFGWYLGGVVFSDSSGAFRAGYQTGLQRGITGCEENGTATVNGRVRCG